MNEIILSGSPRQIGFRHGKQLKSEIHRALDYYLDHFHFTSGELKRTAYYFAGVIRDFNPDYIVEMDAIAEGAGVEPYLVYALNSRSELMCSPHGSFEPECSSIGFSGTGLAGQNWDWAKELYPLIAVADIRPDKGPNFITMLEPGMLAKIGMNSQGIGVMLNILPADKPLKGLPVHILLRALLECRDITQARQLLTDHGGGKASHIMVASEDELLSVECSPVQPLWPDINGSFYAHTNHYLCPGQAHSKETFTGSSYRIDTLNKFLKDKPVSADVLEQALNINDGEYPVLRDYTPHSLFGETGTLVTMLLDCRQRKIKIRHGHDSSEPFNKYRVKE
ncbi:C45 family autoproteolytic acyltransferase/hydolase [Spongorhabdus nitratireducens]